MKKRVVCLLAVLSIGLMGGCNKNEAEAGFSSEKKEEGVNFFTIVSELTGQEATVDNVPYYFSIGSDNSYCTIDTNPFDLDDYSSSTALGYISEMNEKLGLPQYIYQEMVTTSYSQGKQTETVGKISVTWYYHPDKGLNATYKIILG